MPSGSGKNGDRVEMRLGSAQKRGQGNLRPLSQTGDIYWGTGGRRRPIWIHPDTESGSQAD